jgi:hypothetical protein
VITDNQYFLNLFRMIPMAFNLLSTRAKDLRDGIYGGQVDQYCYKIVGTIDRVLPFKLRRVLRTGLYNLLYQGGQVDRACDVSDAAYLSGVGWELAVNRFFDDIRLGGTGVLAGFASVWAFTFYNFYQQLHQRSTTYAAIEHPRISQEPIGHFSQLEIPTRLLLRTSLRTVFW